MTEEGVASIGHSHHPTHKKIEGKRNIIYKVFFFFFKSIPSNRIYWP
jgi:hypothetical protein